MQPPSLHAGIPNRRRNRVTNPRAVHTARIALQIAIPADRLRARQVGVERDAAAHIGAGLRARVLRARVVALADARRVDGLEIAGSEIGVAEDGVGVGLVGYRGADGVAV